MHLNEEADADERLRIWTPYQIGPAIGFLLALPAQTTRRPYGPPSAPGFLPPTPRRDSARSFEWRDRPAARTPGDLR